MANSNTISGSRKRPLSQAAQGESETFGQDNGRRQRNPTRRQQQINDDQATSLQAKIDRQKKELAKQRQKLAEYEEVEDHDKDDDSSTESQDEEDMGYGARLGGGFTSAISSKGTILHGRSVAQKKHLVAETDAFSEEREPLQALDVNRTRHGDPSTSRHDDPSDLEDEDFTRRRSQPPSSPSLALPPLSSPTPCPDRVRGERITMPSSPHSRHEHTTSSRHTSRGVTPSSRRTSRGLTPLSPRVRHMRATLPSSPHSETINDPSAPHQKRIKLSSAPFRPGCTPGAKPKAADYDDGIEKMLLNAMHEYACLILTKDAFPNEVKQTQWAKATWQAACEEAGEHYECSPRMVRLITGRGSWARGFLKDAARNNFKVFKFKEGPINEVGLYNQNLRQSLLRDDAFHHKNHEDVTGFGEHHIVINILRDALFEDNKSYGVKYCRYFNPISINLLALVFTVIEFLIDEWSTGERKKATFRSRTQCDTFDGHYLRTEQWCNLDPTVTTNIRKRMYRSLMKRAGASEQASGATAGMSESMKERAKEALAGRTGETDDED